MILFEIILKFFYLKGVSRIFLFKLIIFLHVLSHGKKLSGVQIRNLTFNSTLTLHSTFTFTFYLKNVTMFFTFILNLFHFKLNFDFHFDSLEWKWKSRWKWKSELKSKIKKYSQSWSLFESRDKIKLQNLCTK